MEYKIKTLEKLLKKLKTEMYINRKSSGLKQEEIDALEEMINMIKSSKLIINCYNRDKALNNINIDLIKKYLFKNDWELDKNFPNKKIMSFKKTYDNDVFYANIPSNEKFKDFKIRVREVISNIAELEEVDFNEILIKIIGEK